jgi:hypothetical protein
MEAKAGFPVSFACERILVRGISVAPLSVVYNFIKGGNDKIVGFDSMRRRISPLNEGCTGNICGFRFIP